MGSEPHRPCGTLEGKAFDPVVVKAAVELHERGELALPSTPNPDVTKVVAT